MTKVVMRRSFGELRPVDEAGRQALARIKLGRDVLVEVKQARNLRHHRWWWALMTKVAHNMEGHLDPEVVSKVICVRTGHVDVLRTAKGEIFVPASISFASMDEIKFREFTDRAVRFICEEILPQVPEEDLRAEIDAMIGPAR